MPKSLPLQLAELTKDVKSRATAGDFNILVAKLDQLRTRLDAMIRRVAILEDHASKASIMQRLSELEEILRAVVRRNPPEFVSNVPRPDRTQYIKDREDREARKAAEKNAPGSPEPHEPDAA